MSCTVRNLLGIRTVKKLNQRNFDSLFALGLNLLLPAIRNRAGWPIHCRRSRWATQTRLRRDRMVIGKPPPGFNGNRRQFVSSKNGLLA